MVMLHFDTVFAGFAFEEDPIVLDDQELIELGEEITINHYISLYFEVLNNITQNLIHRIIPYNIHLNQVSHILLHFLRFQLICRT